MTLECATDLIQRLQGYKMPTFSAITLCFVAKAIKMHHSAFHIAINSQFKIK